MSASLDPKRDRGYCAHVPDPCTTAPAAARRSRVRATVLRAMPSERAIARSLAPQACFRRRISRTRRIDTLSAGIGSPTRHWSVTDRRPLTRPAVEQPTPQGVPTSNRNGRHHVGIGGRLHLGISGRLAPESAVTAVPAAMIAAAVSCRTRTKRMPAVSSASTSVMTSPPGMPKAWRMPAVAKDCATLSATLVIGPRSSVPTWAL